LGFFLWGLEHQTKKHQNNFRIGSYVVLSIQWIDSTTSY
jgi:hypothetical protein